jgi:hypothetical protein
LKEAKLSARQDAAKRISTFIRSNGLAIPHGGDIIRSGNHYTIHFRNSNLDGVVDIYSSKFIRIIYITRYNSLLQRASPVFDSEVAAMDFLNKAFVQHDFEAALAVPSKGR